MRTERYCAQSPSRPEPSCGRASSSRLTPAAIRPNERRESAFRAAANAVSAAAVTPGAWPRRSALLSADRRLRCFPEPSTAAARAFIPSEAGPMVASEANASRSDCLME
jgi:hypothetical protein